MNDWMNWWMLWGVLWMHVYVLWMWMKSVSKRVKLRLRFCLICFEAISIRFDKAECASEWVSEIERVSEWLSDWVIEWLSKSIRYSRTANMNWTSTTSTLSTVWLWFVYTMKLLAVLPCRHVAMCHVPCAMLHCRMKQSEKKQVKWLMIMLNANARINDNELNWTNCQLTRQFERAKQANREWKWALDKQSVWERQRDRESESWKRESVWLNRA